ncbi:MAG TPA: aminoacyl-tRNA hydrolase [Candidatus Nanoarchaeia archaeon]|nr:aminoacyl-tRNA hydrolase [Candidatus Nanoarchaeia archaeon]
MYTIVGLGNPGEEYDNTRHNIGRMFVESFFKKHDLPEFSFDKKLNALTSTGKLGSEKVFGILPETFMNKSGDAVGKAVKTKKAAETLVVVHDELDLPLGRAKISFNKSAGGHRGVESIRKAVKTEEFIRIRIGISPSTASGKLKKPIGEDVVMKFILGKFSKKDEEGLKKIQKSFNEALELLITEGKDRAMNEWNGKL